MISNENEPIRVFGYLRTSTDDGTQEASPEVQENKIRKHCERMGWSLVGIYIDLLPGKTPFSKRPKFQQMISDASAKGVKGIVAISLDRVLRATRILHDIEDRLKQNDLFLTGIDDGLVLGRSERVRAAEKFMLNVQAAANQFWSDFTADKILDKQAYRVHELKLHSGGNSPFGYQLIKDVPHPETGKHYDVWGPDDEVYGRPGGPLGRRSGSEWLRWIFSRFLSCESLQQIATELNEAEVPTPRLIQWNRLSKTEQERRLEAQARRKVAGRAVMQLPPSPWWDSSVLSDLLRSRNYLGEVSYTHLRHDGKAERHKKQWYPGLHPALIDITTFENVQRILEVRGQGNRRSPGQKQEVLLSGLLRCSCSRGLMTRVGRHDGEQDFNYACNFNKKTRGRACNNPRKSGIAVHQAAFQLLMAGLLARREVLLKNPPLPKSPDDSLNKAIEEKLQQRERVKRMAISGVIAEEEAFAELGRINAELEELKQALRELVKPEATIEEIDEFLTNLRQSWSELDFSVKRDIIRYYVPGGFILDHGKLRGKVCGMSLSVYVATQPTTRKDRLEGHYSTHQAAQRLGVTPQAIVAMIKRGKLPVTRVLTGKLWKQYVPCEAIDERAGNKETEQGLQAELLRSNTISPEWRQEQLRPIEHLLGVDTSG